jgi:uncharacterized Tic20 family protein
MALRLKLTLAFAATAMMAVVISFALASAISTTALAALLALIIAGGFGAIFGYMFASPIARALLDLNNVILRFIKWDMDGAFRMPLGSMR